MFTVITRTSNRPNHFRVCRHSVLSQSVKPYHLVGSDCPDDDYPEGDKVVMLDARPGRAHNLYFNTLHYLVPRTHPWIVFLDDDDKFTTPGALQTIRDAITGDDDLLLWQVDFLQRLVPATVGHAPAPGDISGIGFCYHVKHWQQWPGLPMGDYTVISRLYERLRPVWIPQALTGLQAGVGHGKKQDVSK